MISFVELNEILILLWYPYEKEIRDMPNKIIVEDIIDEMIDNIDYIKLNTYIELEKKDD